MPRSLHYICTRCLTTGAWNISLVSNSQILVMQSFNCNHSSFSSSEAKPLVKSPASLFSCCITLVAENLDLVESFCGFPSLIGEKIFKVSITTGRFDEERYITQSIRLFADAFGEELLSGLNISGHHLGLNYYLEQLLLFEHIVELDVSHCGLGDDHEILAHVARLQNLEVLNLGHNAMTDLGVRQMTTPYRMFRRGPAKLRVLLLSGNVELTPVSVKYLSQFLHLGTVALAGCLKFKVGIFGAWMIQLSDHVPLSCVQTKGWASAVVEQWMTKVHTKSKKAKQKPSFFYSRSSFKQEAIIDRQEKSVRIGESQAGLVASRIDRDGKHQATDNIAKPDVQDIEEQFQTGITASRSLQILSHGAGNVVKQNVKDTEAQSNVDAHDIMSIYKIDEQSITADNKTGFLDILSEHDKGDDVEKRLGHENVISQGKLLNSKRNIILPNSKSTNPWKQPLQSAFPRKPYVLDDKSKGIKDHSKSKYKLKNPSSSFQTSCKSEKLSNVSVSKGQPAPSWIINSRHCISKSVTLTGVQPTSSTQCDTTLKANTDEVKKDEHIEMNASNSEAMKKDASKSNPRKRKRIVIQKNTIKTKDDQDILKLKCQKLETNKTDRNIDCTKGVPFKPGSKAKLSFLDSLDLYN